jgi:hypothetical protein
VISIFKKEKTEYVAVILMALFIVFDISLPKNFAQFVDSNFGRALFISLAFIMLFTHNVLGVVALIFVYILITRSEQNTGTYQLRKFVPTQAKKDKYLSSINQFPVTLEEGQIQNLVPFVKNGPASTSVYKPVSGDLHDAAKL